MRTLILTDSFKEFYQEVRKDGEKYVEKLLYVLQLIQNEPIPPVNFLKILKGNDYEGLFEVRANLGNNMYRVFCFFINENYSKELILLNGFKKKDDKTIKKHKPIAVKLKNDYLNYLKEK